MEHLEQHSQKHIDDLLTREFQAMDNHINEQLVQDIDPDISMSKTERYTNSAYKEKKLDAVHGKLK